MCINQDRANERIQNIADNFEKLGIPRAIDQYGRAKGWKANMLRTADGFTVLGIGIETAARGANIEGYRPDAVIIDDVDASSDSLAAIEKKMNTLKRDIIPAGSQDLAVMFVENLMHENSIICQILDGRADFLLDVDVAEIIPAVRNLEVEQVEDKETHRQVYRIIGGEATWEGYNLKSCEQFINSYGLKSFLIECQHEVGITSEGGLWSASDIDRTRISRIEAPEHYTRICVGVDPNVSANNDEAGIVVCGVVPNYKGDKQLHGFVLEDATVKGGPKIWAEAAVSAYNRWQADLIVAEKNNGGDLISITISTIPGAPAVKLVSASRGKITRAEPIQKLWVDQRVHTVGRFDMLEKEMTSYKPLSNMASPDRMDACVWSLTELMLGVKNTKEALTLAAKAVENRGGRTMSSRFGGVW
jgi:hypothetical protein